MWCVVRQAKLRNGGIANCVDYESGFVAANQLNKLRTTHHVTQYPIPNTQSPPPKRAPQ
jgi:hypothetical protein